MAFPCIQTHCLPTILLMQDHPLLLQSSVIVFLAVAIDRLLNTGSNISTRRSCQKIGLLGKYCYVCDALKNLQHKTRDLFLKTKILLLPTGTKSYPLHLYLFVHTYGVSSRSYHCLRVVVASPLWRKTSKAQIPEFAKWLCCDDTPLYVKQL